MSHKTPILLSFYALSNGSTTLLFGQLTYTKIKDLTFKDYNRRRTFRTLFALYRTKHYANQIIVLVFDKAKVHLKTDAYGSFYITTTTDLKQATLNKVLMVSGEEVKLINELYQRNVNEVTADVILISDIDDTLIHSFIYRKLMKFRTLMFTSVEKRKTIDHMQELVRKLSAQGAASFYLSNSEQNLYPLIYRFLLHNEFPPGPVFLKKMRRLWDVIRNIKFPLFNIHKQQTIEDIIALFPEKKFVLIGDNTQHDLSIYLAAAEKFAKNVRYIIIRKVVDKGSDETLLQKHAEFLKANNITLYYSDKFPYNFHF
jgi:phosphatidate phosphatase APP1